MPHGQPLHKHLAELPRRKINMAPHDGECSPGYSHTFFSHKSIGEIFLPKNSLSHEKRKVWQKWFGFDNAVTDPSPGLIDLPARQVSVGYLFGFLPLQLPSVSMATVGHGEPQRDPRGAGPITKYLFFPTFKKTDLGFFFFLLFPNCRWKKN